MTQTEINYREVLRAVRDKLEDQERTITALNHQIKRLQTIISGMDVTRP